MRDFVPMDRLIRLARLWNWLPAFRACAETQNLHRAAARLHVSPSALSRSIHLLETDLGQPLFHRAGRALQLNAAGEALLASLCDAMRLLDDGITELHAHPSARALHVSAFGEVTRLVVVPALCAIRKERPALLIHVHSWDPAEVPGLLLSGQLDVAVVRRPGPTPHLTVEPLGELGAGVYCGRGHPLFAAEAAMDGDVLGLPFVAPVDDEGAGFSDGWPAAVPRRVGMRSADPATAFEVCARGLLLAVLPDRAAADAGRGAKLRRLPVELVPPTPLYALRRESLGAPDASDAIVAALRAQAAGLAAPRPG